MLRRMLLGGGAAALFIGCLFPSFDGLKNDDVKPVAGDDDDDAQGTKKDSGKTSSGTTTSGDPGTSTSSSSGTVADTGTDTAMPQKKTVDCNGKDCDLATQVCCDEANGTGGVCKPKSSGCNVWAFECDDFTDCPDGQLCCKGGGLDIVCAPSCNSGPVICNTGRPCKTSTCSNDELIGPPSVRVKICN